MPDGRPSGARIAVQGGGGAGAVEDMLKPFGELRSVSAEAGGVQGGSSAAGSSGAAALRASSSLPAGSAAPRGGGADQSFVFAEFYDSRCAKQALETLQIDGMVLPGSPPRASVGEGGAAAAAPPAGVAGPGAGAAGRTGNRGARQAAPTRSPSRSSTSSR